MMNFQNQFWNKESSQQVKDTLKKVNHMEKIKLFYTSGFFLWGRNDFSPNVFLHKLLSFLHCGDALKANCQFVRNIRLIVWT